MAARPVVTCSKRAGSSRCCCRGWGQTWRPRGSRGGPPMVDDETSGPVGERGGGWPLSPRCGRASSARRRPRAARSPPSARTPAEPRGALPASTPSLARRRRRALRRPWPQRASGPAPRRASRVRPGTYGPGPRWLPADRRANRGRGQAGPFPDGGPGGRARHLPPAAAARASPARATSCRPRPYSIAEFRERHVPEYLRHWPVPTRGDRCLGLQSRSSGVTTARV